MDRQSSMATTKILSSEVLRRRQRSVEKREEETFLFKKCFSWHMSLHGLRQQNYFLFGHFSSCLPSSAPDYLITSRKWFWMTSMSRYVAQQLYAENHKFLSRKSTKQLMVSWQTWHMRVPPRHLGRRNNMHEVIIIIHRTFLEMWVEQDVSGRYRSMNVKGHITSRASISSFIFHINIFSNK